MHFMKKAIFIFLLFVLPCAASAQSQVDYENVMARFQKFYNAGQSDSIQAMFSDDWGTTPEKRARLWRNGDGLLKEYGKIKSMKYLGVEAEDPDKKVRIFKVICTKNTHATGLSIDKMGKLQTFRFDTSSDGIDEMMKRAK
jgi:hypothetical protein